MVHGIIVKKNKSSVEIIADSSGRLVRPYYQYIFSCHVWLVARPECYHVRYMPAIVRKLEGTQWRHPCEYYSPCITCCVHQVSLSAYPGMRRSVADYLGSY